MEKTISDFVRAGALEELKARSRLVVHGHHRPVLLVYEDGHVFALDNRCPHLGFPLERGSVEDGILTCHWHHARFDLASGCTFDLWADDVPTCPVEIRAGGEIWVKPVFGYGDPVGHWRQRLEDGLAHNLSLVIAKAVYGQLAAGQSPQDVIRQVALFGTRNRDGWDTGLTILTSLSQLLPFLSEEETHLALFHGARRVAADCDGAPPGREREPLASTPDLDTLKRWLRRWISVRHRDAAERTVLTAIASGALPAALADLLFAAETDRAYADGGHSLDFIHKAFECLDVIGWENATDVLPSVVGQMAPVTVTGRLAITAVLASILPIAPNRWSLPAISQCRKRARKMLTRVAQWPPKSLGAWSHPPFNYPGRHRHVNRNSAAGRGGAAQNAIEPDYTGLLRLAITR